MASMVRRVLKTKFERLSENHAHWSVLRPLLPCVAHWCDPPSQEPHGGVPSTTMGKLVYLNSTVDTLEDCALLGTVGGFHEKLGRYQAAKDYHLQALEMKRRVYSTGPEDQEPVHADIATSLHGLGSACFRLSHYQAAKDYFLQALEMQRRVFDGKVPVSSVETMGNLAQVYFKLSRYNEAKTMIRNAVELAQDSLSKNHPTTQDLLEIQYAIEQHTPGGRNSGATQDRLRRRLAERTTSATGQLKKKGVDEYENLQGIGSGALNSSGDGGTLQYPIPNHSRSSTQAEAAGDENMEDRDEDWLEGTLGPNGSTPHQRKGNKKKGKSQKKKKGK